MQHDVIKLQFTRDQMSKSTLTSKRPKSIETEAKDDAQAL